MKSGQLGGKLKLRKWIILVNNLFNKYLFGSDALLAALNISVNMRHLAGSVSGACDAWSWGWGFEPHTGCRDDLKVNSLIKKKESYQWTK